MSDMQAYGFTDDAGKNWLICGPGGWSFGPVADCRSEAFTVAGDVEATCFEAMQRNEGMHLRRALMAEFIQSKVFESPTPKAPAPVETKHGVELATDDAGTHINGASCAVCGGLLWVGEVLWVTSNGLSHQDCEE